MSEDYSLPKHDPPFTEADKWSLCLSSNEWFQKGTVLYHEALRVQSAINDHPERYSLLVGHSIACQINHEHRYKLEREAVAAMLFAFAVECWLKGIAVMRDSPDWREVGRPIQEGIRATLKDWKEADGVDQFDFILRFFETDEYQRLYEETEKAKQVEYRKIKGWFKANKTHNLTFLSQQVGLYQIASPDVKDFLVLLTSMNMQGRYPCHSDHNKVLPCEGVGGDLVRWEKLCDAIFECYNAHKHGSSNRPAGS